MGRARRFTRKHLFIGAAATALLSLSVVPPGGADESPQAEKSEQRFDIPSQPLSEALAEFSRQSKSNVVAPSILTSGRMSAPVAGEMTPETALSQLMRNTGLRIRPRGQGGFVVAQAVADDPKPVRTQLAQSSPQAGADPTADRGGVEDRDEQEGEDVLLQDKVTVTGSIIRGFAPESSPLDVYSRDDILRSGAASAEQFIRTLPQNFGGGSSEFATGGLPNDANSDLNSFYGSGANLRGLGSGGTLVLLNGARLAPTSQIGDYVDLSLIPVSAIEQVDVLTDGASSIYGGDAVAGVINFVLRKDYDGAETALRYGSVTEGNMDEVRFSQTLGKSWGTGGILGVYENFQRDALSLADRPGISEPELVGGGGIGNREAFDLLPEQNRQSALASFQQQLSPALNFSAFGLYTDRETDRSTVNYGGTGTVIRAKVNSESLALAGEALYEFSPDWALSVGGSYNNLNNSSTFSSTGYVVGSGNSESNSEVAAFNTILNGAFAIAPAGDLKFAAGVHFRNEAFSYGTGQSGLTRNGSRDVSAVFAEMMIPLVREEWQVPGVQRLEVSISGRTDKYSDFGSSTNPKVGVLWVPFENLKLRSSYSESFAPPPLGRVGELSKGGNLISASLIATILGYAGQYPDLETTDILDVFGTTNDLEAESSKTLTIGGEYSVDWQDRSISAELNYYDIEFENRLGLVPMPQNLDRIYAPFLALEDPSVFPDGTVIFFPDAQQLSDVLADFSGPIRVYPGSDGTYSNVGIISQANVTRNLAATRTNGLDLQLMYEQSNDYGSWFAGLNANYILEFVRQAAVTTPEVDVLNSLYNPIDLHLRGSFGWSQQELAISAFVNYKDSYSVDSTPGAMKVSSWATVDLNASYTPRVDPGSVFYGTTISLNASNLFDEAPPDTPSFGQFEVGGYDPANASPLGRFVAIELRKEF